MRFFYAVIIVVLFAFPAFAQLNSELIASAEKGNATAQYVVGLAYHGGMNVSQDYKKAVEWLTKSANQGFHEAQVMLGTCYFRGQGVTKDYKTGVAWITKAANQGNAEAQHNLEIFSKL